MKKFINNNLNLIFYTLIVLLTGYFTYRSIDYNLDDALIYFRYIENALNGNGLVYNIGEKFNGLTSPFFTYISFLFCFITQNIQETILILSGIFLALAGIFLHKLLQNEFKSKILAFLPSLILVSSRYSYLTFGMETSLLILLTILILIAYREQKYYLLGILSALIFLTRGESIFLVLIIIIYHFIEKRKFPNYKVFIIPLIILISNYLFNYLYYNELLPHTFSAKMMQGNSELWRSFPFLRISHWILYGFWVIFPIFNKTFIVVLVIVGAIGLIYHIKINRLVQILFIYLILLTSFYVILNIPGYPWYYATYYLVLFILFGYGIDKLLSIENKLIKNSIVIASILIYSLVFFRAYSSIGIENRDLDYKEIGLWLNKNTNKEAKIACVEIGHIGWYSKRYIIDILGLVNPYNAYFIGKKEFTKWLDYYTPDFILVHNPLWTYEKGVKHVIENRTYTADSSFPFTDYLLLKKK